MGQLNQSRQPTPGSHLAAFWASLARRGCANVMLINNILQLIVPSRTPLDRSCLCVVAALAFCFCPFSTNAQGALVQNGQFNSPDGMSIPGWSYPGYVWVPGGGADGGPYVGVSQYISQSLPTAPGQDYLLQFSIKPVTPGIGQAGPYGIGVSWGSQQPVVYQMTTSPGWTMHQLLVTAESANTVLEFTQPYGAWPYLDAVSVVPVPEPSTLVTFCVGIAILVTKRRESKILPA
jgi:hypothetical protein